MDIQSKSIFGLLVCSGFIILLVMLKSKHFVRSLVLSALQGIAALFAVNLLSAVTSVELAVNPITFGISALGGTAGVIMMLVCNTFILH
ncbi:MAG: pro-sigmaK processing inhibitor BofA family protein [Faecalibacterium sp.]|nr:pro-sigmaK processing inhibitor BofA family protein [Ruminococcus sp.]MCM1391507.1 pro-sigmaK processing inhibitor BofA family protein [Ruminococcus sp.]MCM1485871.1 pro-sigmaK processing inhibitor BofA family protein [Faecalibacterium sp.]